ncbi:MAG: PAS domain-containing protein [Armatimonadetes bacterium]|nr:PAS domain-containing protein [Armatimonadota bacterium]
MSPAKPKPTTKHRDDHSPARRAEDKFRALSRLVSDYAYSFHVMPDESLRGEWVSESFARVFEYTLDEIWAQGGWQTLVHPEDLPAAIEHARRVASGKPDTLEFRFLTRRGETRWLLDQAIPVWDPAQVRVVRILGAARDITEHKRLLQSLRESEARYRHFFEHDLRPTISRRWTARSWSAIRRLPGCLASSRWKTRCRQMQSRCTTHRRVGRRFYRGCEPSGSLPAS